MRRTTRLLAGLAALVLAATGCAGDRPGPAPAAGASAGTAGGAGGAPPQGTGAPTTVTTALGTARVPAHPDRVVTLGWGSQDAALALGVVPVAMEKFPSAAPSGYLPWDEPLLRGQRPALLETTSEIPYEQIARLRPDVVLAVYSGLTAEQYATLSKIAPTVAYPARPWSTSWPDQLRLVGQALGRSAEAARLTERTRASVAAAAAAHPEFRGRTAAFGTAQQAGSYYLYRTDDPRMQLLAELGFDLDRTADTVAGGTASTTFATSYSIEQLPTLRADVLVAWYPDAAAARAVAAQPTFRRIGAVGTGAYLAITDPQVTFAASAPNVLSIPWLLDRYVPQLAAAVARA